MRKVKTEVTIICHGITALCSYMAAVQVKVVS